jgi:SPP1 gp7 family putative phage head morphogenesis protein
VTTKKEAREQQRIARQRFAHAQRMEREYMRKLRMLTAQIDAMVKQMADNPEALQRALNSYSVAIEPWARSMATSMVARIAATNSAAWERLARSMGRSLRKELAEAKTGAFLNQMLNEQVHLITSLPLDAAQRVHKLTLEGIVTGRRAEEIRKDILQTGNVTESRAQLIARTEVARTSNGLTMARATEVGSTHYVWRTVGDMDVRKSHKEMDGKVIAWSQPPTLSDGTTTHAGMIYNCRCFPDPVLPDLI